MSCSAAKGRGKLADLQIDSIEPSAPWSPDRSVGEIFEKLGTDPQQAASLMLAYLQDGHSATDAMNHARRLIFLRLLMTRLPRLCRQAPRRYPGVPVVLT